MAANTPRIPMTTRSSINVNPPLGRADLMVVLAVMKFLHNEEEQGTYHSCSEWLRVSGEADAVTPIGGPTRRAAIILTLRRTSNGLGTKCHRAWGTASRALTLEGSHWSGFAGSFTWTSATNPDSGRTSWSGRNRFPPGLGGSPGNSWSFCLPAGSYVYVAYSRRCSGTRFLTHAS